MSEPEVLQSWQINLSIEVEDEQEIESIFELVEKLLNENDYTKWSAKMFRDLNMEQALKNFRDHKEEILASLPPEIVEQYYPERKVERHLSVVPEMERENEQAKDKNAS